MKFIAIGDNCVDSYTETDQKYAGGNAVNFAVYMKELLGSSAYFGVVGDDANGQMIIESLHAKGVDASMVRVEPGNTAVTVIRLVNGDRVFGAYDEGVFAQFAIKPEELAYIKNHDYIHMAVYGKCDPYLEELHQSCVISYDFSDKRDVEFITQISKHIDYGFISYHQDDAFIREILRKMCDQHVQVAVATLGEQGSIAFDGQCYYVCGIKQVNVVDTLGAGDSFIAGFMYGISQGQTIEEALQSGTDRASKTIQYVGAW